MWKFNLIQLINYVWRGIRGLFRTQSVIVNRHASGRNVSVLYEYECVCVFVFLRMKVWQMRQFVITNWRNNCSLPHCLLHVFCARSLQLDSFEPFSFKLWGANAGRVHGSIYLKMSFSGLWKNLHSNGRRICASDWKICVTDFNVIYYSELRIWRNLEQKTLQRQGLTSNISS